jgi:hypothetical protein
MCHEFGDLKVPVFLFIFEVFLSVTGASNVRPKAFRVDPDNELVWGVFRRSETDARE